MSTTLTIQITLYAEGEIETDMDNALEDEDLREDFAQGVGRDLKNEVAYWLKIPTHYIYADTTLLNH